MQERCAQAAAVRNRDLIVTAAHRIDLPEHGVGDQVAQQTFTQAAEGDWVDAERRIHRDLADFQSHQRVHGSAVRGQHGFDIRVFGDGIVHVDGITVVRGDDAIAIEGDIEPAQELAPLESGDDEHRLIRRAFDYGRVGPHRRESKGGRGECLGCRRIIEEGVGVSTDDHIHAAHGRRQHLVYIVAQMAEEDDLVNALAFQRIHRGLHAC